MALLVAQPRIAVLIDGENFPAASAQALFEAVRAWGEPAVRRVYGNQDDSRMKAWVSAAKALSVTFGTSQGHTKSKNSSDIALCIDAMDLLLTRRLAGFCIVTSDSDFTHLVHRIREHGLRVYGVGEIKANPDFRASYDEYRVLDAAKEKAASKQPKTAPSSPKADLPKPEALKSAPAETLKKQPPSMAFKALNEAVQAARDQSGWTSFSKLKSWMQTNGRSVTPETYGQDNLSNLLRKAGFEVEPSSGTAIRLRKKLAPSKLPFEPMHSSRAV